MVSCRHVKKQELRRVTEANCIHWSRLEPVTSCSRDRFVLKSTGLNWLRMEMGGDLLWLQDCMNIVLFLKLTLHFVLQHSLLQFRVVM